MKGNILSLRYEHVTRVVVRDSNSEWRRWYQDEAEHNSRPLVTSKKQIDAYNTFYDKYLNEMMVGAASESAN